MKNILKITSIILIFSVCASVLPVSAHNLGAMSEIHRDYSKWNSASATSLHMPAPEPTPTPCTDFEEVEIARAHTTYETYAAQANRNTNMFLATKSIDYAVIQNGEVFSFNTVVGPRSEERGYKEATIFVGQEKRPGLGGGICQISSTVYMAAKKANLEIVERHAHSMPVTYCSRDDEATVSWGYLDFKFKNNTGDAIRLEATCSGGIVKVIIYQRVPKN